MVEADTKEIGIDATVKNLSELTFNEDTTLHIKAINIAPANIQKYKIVVKIENHEVAALPDVRNKATSDQTTDSEKFVNNIQCKEITDIIEKIKKEENESKIKLYLADINTRKSPPDCADKVSEANEITKISFTPIKIGSNQKATITFYINGEEHTKFVYTTKPIEWLTHVGFTFVASRDKRYFTAVNTDGHYIIQKQSNQPDFNYAATAMYTYPIHSFNDSLDLGFSAGLGVNADTVLVVTGPSLVFSKNVLLNLGLVMSQFDQLNGTYTEGQDVGTTSIDSTSIHQKNFAPSVAITVAFRF